MQVSNMVPGPPVLPGRGGGRPAAAAQPAEATNAGRPAAFADEKGGEPTRLGGSQTPFTHALHQGNGHKHGIHRRLAAAEAAQQYQAELGLTPPAEAGEEVTDPPPVEAAPDTEGEAPVADIATDAAAATTPEAPAAASPVDPDAGEVTAPEPFEPIDLDLPSVDPVTTDLLDALEEVAAAPTEPEPA